MKSINSILLLMIIIMLSVVRCSGEEKYDYYKQSKILSNKLVHLKSWVYHDSQNPLDFLLQESGNIIVIDTKHRIVTFNKDKGITFSDLKFNEKKVKIIRICEKNANVYWIIFWDKNDDRNLALWDKSLKKIELVFQVKNPQDIYWLSKRNELWYIDNENLYKFSDGKSSVVLKRGREISFNDSYIISEIRDDDNEIYKSVISDMYNINWKNWDRKTKYSDYEFRHIDQHNRIIGKKYDEYTTQPSVYAFISLDTDEKEDLLEGDIAGIFENGKYIATLRYNPRSNPIIDLYLLKE